jgi:type IV secretory pathway TraG/TraD family ATPase VirD4
MFSTVLRKLDTFRLTSVRRVCVGNGVTVLRPRGWTWDDIFDHDKPSAIFIHTGLMPGGEEYVRLVLENAVNTVRRRWDDTGEPLKHGLLLIGDEMQKLGFCRSILDANVELRKAGVVNLLCYPSLSDIHRIYGEFSDSLISGCELVAFGGAKESKYYRELSDLIGECTEYSHSESEGRVSKHETVAPLARPAWLRQLPYDELVGVVGNLNIHANKLFESVETKRARFVRYR